MPNKVRAWGGGGTGMEMRSNGSQGGGKRIEKKHYTGGVQVAP